MVIIPIRSVRIGSILQQHPLGIASHHISSKKVELVQKTNRQTHTQTNSDNIRKFVIPYQTFSLAMRRCHLQSRPTAPMSSVDKLTSAKRPNMSEPCCSLKARTQLEEKLELNLMGILARFDESQDAFNVA